jgi:hypothetical protein
MEDETESQEFRDLAATSLFLTDAQVAVMKMIRSLLVSGGKTPEAPWTQDDQLRFGALDKLACDLSKREDLLTVEFLASCASLTERCGRGFINRAMSEGKQWERGLSVPLAWLFPTWMIADTVASITTKTMARNVMRLMVGLWGQDFVETSMLKILNNDPTVLLTGDHLAFLMKTIWKKRCGVVSPPEPIRFS